MKRIIIALVLIVGAAAGIAGGIAVAQDDERSRFVRFVERQISTPDRQIRLGQINGALSSNVKISSITIADRDGVWLTIDGAELVWSRLALLRGRLAIDSLKADAITVTRTPLPAETDEPIDPDAEFELPSLPVSVNVKELAVARVELAEGVVGPAAAIKLNGRARLADGELDVNLDVDRLDRPGTLDLAAVFDSSRNLSVDLTLSEPEDGVLANTLQIEGRPPIVFSVKGDGPLTDYSAAVSLKADGDELLGGTLGIAGVSGGMRFTADINGNLTPLVASLYAPLVEGGSAIQIDATRNDDGRITVDAGTLKTGVAALSFKGAFSADGIPVRLDVDGDLKRDDGAPIALPGGGGDSTIREATIDVSLGQEADGAFTAAIILTELDSPVLSAPTASIRASGTATNMADPAARAVDFTVTGRADELASDRPGVSEALGDSLALDVAGSWRGGQPLTISAATLDADAVDVGFAGTVLDAVDGRYTLKADQLSVLSEIAGRPLGGSVDLNASGKVGFDGTFDITVDGTTQDLVVGVDAADGLLSGTTRLTGSASRTEDSIAFDNFAVRNSQLSLNANGTVSPAEANLLATLDLANLNAVAPELQGAISARLGVTGAPASPVIALSATSDRIDLRDQTLTGLDLTFDGTLTRESETPFDLDGRLALAASLSGEPVRLSATLSSDDGARSLRDLAAQVVDATANGNITLKDGLVAGRLQLNVPELSRLAPLALTDASGSLNADVTLSNSGETQDAAVKGTAREIRVAGVSLGFAAIDLTLDDVTGIPAADGTADIRALQAAGYTVRTAGLTARRDGETTNLSLSADLGRGTLEAAGALSRLEEGFAAALSEFRLASDSVTAVLKAPTRVTVTNANAITIEPAALDVGGGEINVGGALGDTLDFEATIRSLPLSIANLIKPDLGVDGEISGTLDLTGTKAEPVFTAMLDADRVTAAMLRERGIDPITLTADASYQDGTATIRKLEADVAGGTIEASGTAGERFDLDASVTALPLALANAFVPDLALAGTLSGTAKVEGTMDEPQATFAVQLRDALAKPLRDARTGPVTADVAGSLMGETVSLTNAVVRLGNGRISATGDVGENLDLKVRLADLPLAIANAYVPDMNVSGTLSGDATVTGTAASPMADFTVSVRDVLAAPLRAAATGPLQGTIAGRLNDETVTLSRANVTVGRGQINATGTVGQSLDLTVNVDSLPLALANFAAPDVGVDGALSGRATITGRAANPRVTFNMSSPRLSTAATRQAGLPAGEISAAGTYANGTAAIDRALVRIGGGEVRASGRVGDRLDVRATITSLPLSLANGVQPGLDIGGRLAGTVSANGSLTRPAANFDLNVSGLSAAPLASAGVSGVDVRASGQFANNTVRLTQARATGSGLDVSASGTVPLSGGGLNLTVNAEAPLSLADAALASRGARATGTVVANVRVGGSLSDPQINGDVRTSGATFRDPLSNLVVNDITLDAGMSGDRVNIRTLRAGLGDGTVTVTGSVGLNNGFPADLAIALRNARYADGKLFAVTLGGDLTVTGNLTGAPTVAGVIDVDRAEITVPEQLGGSGTLIDVRHVDPSRAVLETLRRAQFGPYASTNEGGTDATGLNLDVTVNAPRRIFIRGRGIDAELGGNLRVTGPISDVVPVGQFDLIRGRLNILGQRITFTEGSVSLVGDLNPSIRLVAETQGNGVTVRVIVSGDASSPDVSFESTPELPQDEVLAQLLFGRSIGDLSAFQIAQLAAAVAELAGSGGGPGILEQLRVFSGLDNLEIVTDEQGNTAAQAGRYIADNIYLGVRAGESSGITVNIDITKNLKFRGEAMTDESTLGIYFEREY
ncbi:translocation/assembly module TamB domain-containing protein [Acuticoccus sp. MNP-M23]|uniref:translocation/assembly module TamB domain-containing protein n=1 Tax=Acuticoccus sp. MNP-M23 TaxID=3072793 RepID=UPI0028165609|nr:translocation/assembly module TamB domain-containing protein [Acuticoccus sp. MNP-M23]WMS44728.1 translocation/assembly module TamB domain-containing protein [Acuticoccus sp. MNP-M23]